MLARVLSLFTFLFAVSTSSIAVTYVPVRVGDITVILPIDDPPVANSDVMQFNQDSASTVLSLNVLANDLDESLNSVQVEIIDASGFSASISSDNKIDISLPANWYGIGIISYRLIDEKGQLSTAANAEFRVNALPDAKPDSEIIQVSSQDISHVMDVLANDFDEELTNASITVLSSEHHNIAVTSDKQLSIRIPANWAGRTTFTYQLTDVHGVSDSVISALYVNRPPSAFDDREDIYAQLGVCDANTTPTLMCYQRIDLLGNDTDPEGSALTIKSVLANNPQWDFITSVPYVTQSRYGLLNIDNGIATYFPKSEFFSIGNNCMCDRFTYTVEDAHGGIVSATVQFTLQNANPVLVDDEFTYLIGSGIKAIDILANDYDPEGQDLEISRLRFSGSTVDLPLSLSVDNDQRFLFEATDYFSASLDVQYDAKDLPTGNESRNGKLKINLVPLGTSLKPTITTSGGEYGNEVTVIIEPGHSGDEIWYTLDGTSPEAFCDTAQPAYCQQGSNQSNIIKYTGPFSIPFSSSAVVVRAIGKREGYAQSPEVSKTFSFSLSKVEVRNLAVSPSKVFPNENITLSWSRPTGIPSSSRFEVAYTREGLGSDAPVSLEFINGTSRTSQLRNPDWYTYFVRVCNNAIGSVCGPFSSIRVGSAKFSVTNLKATPATININQSTTITWGPDPSRSTGVKYRVTGTDPQGNNLGELLSGTNTSLTQTPSINGTYEYRVTVCDNNDSNCGEDEVIRVQVGDAPEVVRFEWERPVSKVGQETTFFWNIRNVRKCFALTHGNGANPERAASGESGPHAYYEVEQRLTQWYCEDNFGNRFPAQGYLEATHNIIKLESVQRVEEK